MTGLAELFAGIAAGEAVTVPERWRQGRTAFGGLSSALAFHAARAGLAGPPPLRSAQIAFVGPVTEGARAAPALLRRGRTAAFVACDLTGADGRALDARFVFGDARGSTVAATATPAPAVLPTGYAPRAFPEDAPAFLANFELADAALPGEARPGTMLSWVRVAGGSGLDPVAELILIGDVLPPAAITLAGRRGPLSSMTWQFDLLTGRPETEDGWWLLRSEATHAADGFSSQRMAVWDSGGRQVMSGMQMVALFF